MIWECWIDNLDHPTEITFASKDNYDKNPWMKLSVEDRPLIHIYSVISDDYNEAMTAHNEAQGWGPYVPMED